jgi:hypothetical protein
MRRTRVSRSGIATSLLVVLLLLGAASATSAQGASPPVSLGPADFLLGRPDGSIAVRGSWLIARAGSDLYRFVERELTVDKGDFNRALFASDFGITLTPRADAVIGLEVSRASIGSEYRNFVDNDRLPIEQTTTLKELNLTGSIRFALAPRGREISRLAWIPARVVPYAGAGGGMLWYQFTQAGDFIDALDPRLAVFPDRFESEGFTPSAHVFGGVDVKLTGRWFLTMDGRFVWAQADLGPDFVQFDPIDLAGFRFGAGVNILF